MLAHSGFLAASSKEIFFSLAPITVITPHDHAPLT